MASGTLWWRSLACDQVCLGAYAVRSCLGHQWKRVGAIRFPETAGGQGMGSTPQGVTTCCPTSGGIPDPLGEGGNKSVFPTVATGPQSVKREETRPHRDLDPEQPLAGRHGERKRTLRRTIVISKEPTQGKRLCPKWTWLAEGSSISTRDSTSPPPARWKESTCRGVKRTAGTKYPTGALCWVVETSSRWPDRMPPVGGMVKEARALGKARGEADVDTRRWKVKR
jgi:hypothetical protein